MKRKPLPAKSKVSAFIELTKPRITILILISTALGYYLAESEMINYLNFFYTIPPPPPKNLDFQVFHDFLIFGGRFWAAEASKSEKK